MSAKNTLGRYPKLHSYIGLVREDLSQTFSRDLHKWLIIAPIMGVFTGLLITLLVKVILYWMWPPLLHFYLAHRGAIVPGVVIGFVLAGLLMQFLTPDPDEHSTEEIIRSYHEHQGRVTMRPVVPKLLAAIATVGMGGSAALEGPSIYGGGAIGSWLWKKLRKLRLEERDRRIMLISGAAAGMSAVFRAPLTGIVFALEMPYKDDLAHEALLPSLIASVTSFATMAAFVGARPLFDFVTGSLYTREDLLWSALLGAICGAITMVFDITFRRVRGFSIRTKIPHWIKMAVGGLLTGVCGLIFVSVFKGSLIPIGPNYEAVPLILQQAHSSVELVSFGVMKLAATLFSLGVGGVSAAFVPLFLTGSSFGAAFAQSIAHSSSIDLFAAVGMAAFIAGGYKTPLTAVVFVAEATGGHAFIVPTLIGAAVAYAVSGEASMSGDQRVHESARIAELSNIRVSSAMQKRVILADARWSVGEFVDFTRERLPHTAYPVIDEGRLAGTISMVPLGAVSPDKWDRLLIRDVMNREAEVVAPNCDLQDALRLLMAPHGQHMLIVTSEDRRVLGIVTKTDVLSALSFGAGETNGQELHTEKA
ncbi:MAG TPA: chloride channel protein [Candidatus Dormibacteraeota bacterium]|nr:chloride channel protein [Candidatus Dormibacteraeota bacterium]